MGSAVLWLILIEFGCMYFSSYIAKMGFPLAEIFWIKKMYEVSISYSKFMYEEPIIVHQTSIFSRI